MDLWNAETVRGMCRYITDDRRIARHVGCSIENVRSIRAKVSITESELIARRRPDGVGPSIAEDQFWQNARRGSERLAAAMARALPVEDFREGWTAPASRPWKERHPILFVVVTAAIGIALGWGVKSLIGDQWQRPEKSPVVAPDVAPKARGPAPLPGNSS